MEVKIKKTKREVFLNFIKKNIYYVLIGLGIVVVAVVLAIGGKPQENPGLEQNPPGPITPVVNDTVNFNTPLENVEILKDYSSDELMYNETLKQWEAHKAIDFKANEGTSVVAVADGKVEQVYDNYAYGTVVVISHNNGYKSVYSSLAKDTSVSIGQQITAGTTIGLVGKTANKEFINEPHLRLEMYKDNILIDPNEIIAFSDK